MVKMPRFHKQVDLLIKKGLQFVNDNPKIIKGIYKQISYNDEPKLYGYIIYFKDKYSNAESENAGAAGLSLNKKKALLKALGETLERYSLSANNNRKFIFSSFNELVKLNKSAFNPKSLILFSDKKPFTSYVNRKKLHWVEGKSLISNKKVLVPAQLVYIPYLYQNSEPILRFPISTGAAAGVTLTDALYRGICEVVERDAFMIAYLNKIPSPLVDLPAIKDKLIYDIINVFKKYKLELIVLDLTTDLQIPAFAAITIDKTGIGPAVSVGLKAGFNIKETIVGAIEESLMVRFWTRDEITYKTDYKRSNVIKTIGDRAYFWSRLSSMKYLDFWLNSKIPKKVNIREFKHLDNNLLENVIKLLSQKNIEIIYVDITDETVKKHDFVVVKVIIPQLQPLYLEEDYPYFREERLFNTPVAMGFLQKPKIKSQLNKIPHPFL